MNILLWLKIYNFFKLVKLPIDLGIYPFNLLLNKALSYQWYFN